MDPVSAHARCLGHLRDVVSRVPDDAWDMPTNCEPWTASTLLNHALESQLLWVAAVTGDESAGSARKVMRPEPLEGDPLARTDEVIDRATQAWATEGVLDRDITGAFGTNSGADTIVYPSIDALAHSWDLATSVGIDAELPEDLVAVGEELVGAAINETTIGYGLFADEVEVGPDASPTDRLMARAGRVRPSAA